MLSPWRNEALLQKQAAAQAGVACAAGAGSVTLHSCSRQDRGLHKQVYAPCWQIGPFAAAFSSPLPAAFFPFTYFYGKGTRGRNWRKYRELRAKDCEVPQSKLHVQS